jgi:hypothetical protein
MTNSPSVTNGGAITLTSPYTNSVRAFTQAAGYQNSGISTSGVFTVVGGGGGDWYNPAWTKRAPVTVTNSGTSVLTNYDVKMAVPYANNMKGDFADLRFTKTDKTNAIPYWLQGYTVSNQAVVWVQVPLISASSVTQIWMYYGNASATSASDEGGTFSSNVVELLTNKTWGTWGGGNDSLGDDPYNTSWEDVRAESVYTTNDLTSAGVRPVKLTAFQLYVRELPGTNLANFRIRIQHTTTNSVASGNFITNGYTAVYGPTTISRASLTVSNWYTHGFTNAFYWNQTNNLLLDLSKDDSTWAYNGGMAARTTTVQQTRSYRADSATNWPFDGGTVSYRRYLLPAVKVQGLFRPYIVPEPTCSIGAEE